MQTTNEMFCYDADPKKVRTLSKTEHNVLHYIHHFGQGGTQSKDKVSENAAVRLAINLTWYKAVGTGLVYECVTSCLVLAKLITYFGAIWE